MDEFTKSDEQYGIIVTSFDEGLIFTEQNIAVITESELFGNSYIATKRNNKNVQADAIIRNLAELKTGEKIVHYKYGIGCYRGLEIRDINGINKEFFCLEYADNARLYVEITELHLISRYTGGANPPLNKLGSDTWVKNREKARKKVKDVAVQLLDVYSKRATRKGFRFKFDKTAYNSFVADFPYVETEDQKKAILSVITDMTQAKTMDRLICGDVGFGKTEVAIRAAFIAVSNSKQVAVLVPTVLLAEQHYDTFKNRFSNEAVTIESLSRFKTAGQQTRILEDLAEGKIDIIIGTHKLLSKTVKYKDLGLLIVDEEHRFGVKQKEMIKAMRSDVDILTLTATPIPRTLNMAFSGLRDLSLITTPPAKRLAIKTFLKQMDFSIIREAVARELKRGGQVYYIHNEVSTIEHRAEELRNLLPEARIEVAHGQMNERMLGLIMNNFYRHKFDILVCTTIIETGIDIPSANTMIIERADKFGLAQLHQIRGRVGRSSHQAYAYLLTPPPKLMSRDAVKRLEAITMHEDLGVGFALANHDLEIRGAGELLGDEQSGQIAAVGFTLYMEMLNKAINSLKDGDELSLTDLSARNTEINLDISALIPATYIDDVSTRLIFYKRLVSAANDEELQSIKAEMIDRFGPVPQELSDLFEIHKLRIKVEPLGIDSIAMNNVTRFIKFNTRNKINPDRIVKLLMKYPKDYALEGLKLRIIPKVEPQEQIKFINDVISNIV
jgi:transcription-repair coupling factor (superfamily II helicase)